MESDRLVTLLTADYGLVNAFVRGAKQLKTGLPLQPPFLHTANFQFISKTLTLLTALSLLKFFFDLRKDIERLAVAQYFAQLAFELANEGQPEEEMLSVILNSFHLLCKGEKAIIQIKSVVEFRLMSLSGYMPNILACANCGTYETDIMYFDTLEGCIYCENCQKIGAIACPKNVITL